MDYKRLYFKYKTKYFQLKNSDVIYTKNNKFFPVKIEKKHIDVDEEFYTIKFMNGSERQTTKNNLIFNNKN